VRRRVLVSGPLKPRAAAHLRTAVSASTGAACINTVKEIPRPLESKLQEDNALIADVAANEAGMAADGEEPVRRRAELSQAREVESVTSRGCSCAVTAIIQSVTSKSYRYCRSK
jgi:hypothetical protein